MFLGDILKRISTNVSSSAKIQLDNDDNVRKVLFFKMDTFTSFWFFVNCFEFTIESTDFLLPHLIYTSRKNGFGRRFRYIHRFFA